MDYRLDNYNFSADARNCAKAETPVLHTDDGEVELPCKWEVCPVCDGKGKHVNPAIDAGGLSDELACDPDFRASYSSGLYDVQCNLCAGRTTVPAIDRDRMTAEQCQQWDLQCDAERENEAERLAEIRMGC